ncbi:MAG: HD domain-containing phosphohydrolase [Candidatus Tantalella remota]|nr:HD domain-containing phosphohydrolase [Candidatus Tantalella remota]
MVDFHKGFEGAERLGDTPRRGEPDKLELSKHSEEAGGLESLLPDIAEISAVYDETLAFVKQIFNMVSHGQESQIKAEDILSQADKICNSFLKPIDPGDLVRLAFAHDDYRTSYIYEHSVNVCFLCFRVAMGLNFPKKRMRDIVIAALFHDVGMVKFGLESVWNRSARLTEEEYGLIRKHPTYGEDVFKGMEGISDAVASIIGQHQERSDGTGYPNQLMKEDINYLARLVSLVNRYEAQTHLRLWRTSFLPDKTIQQILDLESTSYDPHFMKAMLRTISVFPVGSWVKLSSGEIGTVLRTNEATPMRPVIKVVFERNKNPLPVERIMDLSKQLLIHLVECVNPEELPATDEE